MKCNTCRNLCKRRDDDGTLYDWCGKIVDCPDRDLQRQCKYYQAATNGDKIRAMTDEELSKKISGIESFALTCGGGWTPEKWLDWLKQETAE